MKGAIAPDFAGELRRLEATGLIRELRRLDSAPAARVTLAGREVVNFASNNYLDLAGADRLKRAAAEALDRWGTGATASRLLGGTLELHERLEAALADFKRTESAAVFPSGWHVNTGLLPALAGPGDAVVLDRLAHASLVDGARLSRATLRVFRHNDPGDLDKVLRRLSSAKRRWVATESVFSMDGDVAPLRELREVARRRGARLYVDEAHATGVFGPEGRGVVNALGLEREVDACMGTLSKALGGLGGFVCGSRELIAWVHNKCRAFIYSTALPPACLASALAALEICRNEPARRERLFALSGRMRKGIAECGMRIAEWGKTGTDNTGFHSALRTPHSAFPPSPIVPFVVGGEREALELAARFWDAGVYAPAIRPPTVPKGTARIRFSVTAGHTEEDIDRVLSILRGVVK